MTDTPLPPVSAPRVIPPQPPLDLLTAGMIDALRKTKPWVRFLAILGFVFVVLMLLVSLGMLVFGIYQVTVGKNEGYMLVGMGVLYVALAVLYIFPSRYLYRYADSIKTALTARSKTAAVEEALRQQKSFWKFAGIMTLIGVLLYIPGILAAIAIPNLLTAMQRSKQKRSMADIRTVATAVDAFARDQGYYPDAKNVGDLAPMLQPKYLRMLPRMDGWGHPIQYEGTGCLSSRCTGYFLASGGKNGRLEQPASSRGSEFVATTNFDEDIVYSGGKFLRAPADIPR